MPWKVTEEFDTSSYPVSTMAHYELNELYDKPIIPLEIKESSGIAGYIAL